MMPSLPNSIAALRQQLRTGRLNLPEVVREQVKAFERIGQMTHAVTSYRTDALPVADVKLPLAGVGVAHKDIFDLIGRRPGLGRHFGEDTPGVSQAWAPAQLERAGAVNLGAVTMAEDACAATGQTEKLPTPLNPLGEDIAVGGSSSGSAVAVASGMVYASLGTDTAGSVRIPAMTCGVMGLKTTHGLISRQGMTLLCPSLDSIGVLARSTGDLADVSRVLAPELGWDEVPPAGNVKVGYWLEGAELDDSVSELVRGVMQRYGQVSVLASDHERRATALQEMIMAYEVGRTHAARIASGQACQQVAGLGAYGLAIPKAWWHEALGQRSRHTRAFVDEVLGDVDVLIAPLQTSSLPKTGEVYLGHEQFKSAKLLGLHRYCGWVNYLGLPALSMPIGMDSTGLPVSVQLIGRPFAEPLLLAVGEQLQNEIHGAQGIMPVLKMRGD